MKHDPLLARRAIPADATLATWQAADGWPVRRFDRAGTGRGAILFQGGRADMIEKYLEALDDWHRAGWSVTSFDWRGQGGSGRLAAGSDVGHADSFVPWLDDLERFWGEWTAAHPGPHVVIGHSMGGYLTLQALVEGRIRADAAVLVAPMLGLRSPIGAVAGGWLARVMRGRGDPARAAFPPPQGPRATARHRARLTADAGRLADVDWWYDRDPTIRLGPPSWAWLAEAFAATARLRADPRLATMEVPTLMLAADEDRLVDPRAVAAVASRLPDARLTRFGQGCAHEILRETDVVRAKAMDAIADFLDAVAPPR